MRNSSQRLYDHAFALAALLEEIDNTNLLLSPEVITPLLTKYLRRCCAMDAKFNLWYQALTRESPAPLYWPTPPNDDSHDNVAAPADRRPISFPDLRTASAITTFWSCKLVLSNTIAIICASVLSPNSCNRGSDDPQSFAVLEQTARQLLIQHGDTGRLEHATNIMRSMPYCLHDSMGFLGLQKTLFALLRAVSYLRESPDGEFDACMRVYQETVEKKGLGCARKFWEVVSAKQREAGGKPNGYYTYSKA